VVTGTDAGTEFGEDEDVEMKEPSPGQFQDIHVH
jgi:MRG-binding protein